MLLCILGSSSVYSIPMPPFAVVFGSPALLINDINTKMSCAHCKKLEVDLTEEISSQLPSGFIQVQAVDHLLLPWFPCPVKQTVNLVANQFNL